MIDYGSDHCQCFFRVQVNTSNASLVIVDVVECSDSNDDGECAVRILNSWSLIRERKKCRVR